MRHDYTHINVILGRSGSMEPLTNDTIGGFNSFLAEQKRVGGKATLTLTTFSSSCTTVYDFVPLDQVANLTAQTYRADGKTALLDAVGRTVNSVGVKLAAMNEEDRPSKVITLVITDGQENASLEFDLSTIKSMVDHQTTKYNWLFIYPSSGLDAFHDKQSKGIGISTFNTAKFAHDSIGTAKMYGSISRNLTSYRSKDAAHEAASYNFFQGDGDKGQTIAGVQPQPTTFKCPDCGVDVGLGGGALGHHLETGGRCLAGATKSNS